MEIVWVSTSHFGYKAATCGSCGTHLVRLRHEQTNRVAYGCPVCELIIPQPVLEKPIQELMARR